MSICTHKPVTYEDGVEVWFLLPKASVLGRMRTDKPISALACLCVECGCFYVATEDRKDWGLKAPKKTGDQT